MSKLIYIDTETTGVDSKQNGLTEIACILVENSIVIDSIDLRINPMSYKKPIKVEIKALEITKITLEEVESYPNSIVQFDKFIGFLDKHVDKFNKDDKLQVVGYNVGFDIDFLKQWFIDNNHKYYGSYFSYKDIDVFALVKHLKLLKMIDTPNDKLETLCDYYGIKIDAHNALSDIEATRELYQTIIDKCEGYFHFANTENIL